MLTYLTKKKENNKHLMSQYGINRINILNELINKKPIKKKTSNDSKKPLSMAKTTTTNTRNSQNERVSNTNTVNLIPQSRNKNVKRHVSIDTKSTLNDKTKRCIEYSIKVKKLNMTNTSNIVIPQTKKSEVSSNKKSRNAKNRSNISYKNSIDKSNIKSTFNLDHTMIKMYTTKTNNNNISNMNKTMTLNAKPRKRIIRKSYDNTDYSKLFSYKERSYKKANNYIWKI